MVLNASSTVRHVNDVHYSVCAHTMFLKHNVCSFVSLTSMAKKTRRVLTWRGWSFLHTPLAKVCTRENDKQPCIRETKYTRKKVLLGYYICYTYNQRQSQDLGNDEAQVMEKGVGGALSPANVFPF